VCFSEIRVPEAPARPPFNSEAFPEAPELAKKAYSTIPSGNSAPAPASTLPCNRHDSAHSDLMLLVAGLIIAIASISLAIRLPALSWAFILILAVGSFIIARGLSGFRKVLLIGGGLLSVLLHVSILAATQFDIVTLVKGSVLRYTADVPNRASFEKRLASVQMRTQKGGISIFDAAGEQLFLKIRADSDSYRILVNFDPIDTHPMTVASPNGEPHIAVQTVKSEEWIVYSSTEFAEPKQERMALRKAVDTMIDWSISQAENRIPRVDRHVIDLSPGDAYVFHGNFDTQTYQLIREFRDMSPYSIQALNSGGTLGSNTGITAFHRVHLWKYLLDHIDDIQKVSDSEFDRLRSEDQERTLQATKMREQAQVQAKAAETEQARNQRNQRDKMDQLFPRPDR
jgi:hypothetical protein